MSDHEYLKCPRCGCERISRIVYGLPDFTDELLEKIESKEIILGGCMLSGARGNRKCQNCGMVFVWDDRKNRQNDEE